MGENASFAVPHHQVVLRVTSAANTGRVAREISIAQWLLTEHFPVVRPIRSDLISIDAWVVSLWEQVPDPSIASTRNLGQLLHQLHGLAPPTEIDLPRLDPLAGVEGYLSAAHGLDSADVAFLRRRRGELRQAFTELDFTLQPGPVHGDAHRKNVVRGSDGHVVMLDLERVSCGPREWDLIVAATYADLGWYTPEEYAGFVDAYGADIRDWSGYATLLEIRKLRMTAWLCARTGREPRLRAEAAKRIATVRDPALPTAWTPGV
ncbi:phosphotransferase family enzyme [Murinocardiopsis flavida]|uniref:Phosphotransferase family enzyme n=1 Tax=Murinocardiopsis flavida TaxID=645275 RepID=A0A2P8DG70_9ACTN|nr:phosphotransferase family enzyme [Murinocardiopsis flavida]